MIKPCVNTLFQVVWAKDQNFSFMHSTYVDADFSWVVFKDAELTYQDGSWWLDMKEQPAYFVRGTCILGRRMHPQTVTTPTKNIKKRKPINLRNISKKNWSPWQPKKLQLLKESQNKPQLNLPTPTIISIIKVKDWILNF